MKMGRTIRVLGFPVVVVSAAVLGSIGTTGCAAASNDGETATATTTSALQAQSETALTDGVIEADGDLAPDPEEAAKRVVDHPMPNVQPAGCATKTREGNVVTLKLSGCTGPFGKVVVEGSLVATFSRTTPDVLHVEIAASDDMNANGGPVAYASQIDIRYDGTQRTLTYHGHSSGKTQRGVDYARDTDLTVVTDAATHCGRIDGTSKGSVGRYEIDLDVEGLAACRNACPTGGVARATVDGPLVASTAIQVSFDGSETAHVEIDGRKTRNVDVALDCAAGEAAD
jgi:hypothetical protein